MSARSKYARVIVMDACILRPEYRYSTDVQIKMLGCMDYFKVCPVYRDERMHPTASKYARFIVMDACMRNGQGVRYARFIVMDF